MRGAEIAIAAVWISVCALLGFLAWLLVTHIHIKNSHDGADVGFAYLILAFLLIVGALRTTEAVRSGRR